VKRTGVEDHSIVELLDDPIGKLLMKSALPLELAQMGALIPGCGRRNGVMINSQGTEITFPIAGGIFGVGQHAAPLRS
jgi:hypothetical protein